MMTGSSRELRHRRHIGSQCYSKSSSPVRRNWVKQSDRPLDADFIWLLSICSKGHRPWTTHSPNAPRSTRQWFSKLLQGSPRSQAARQGAAVLNAIRVAVAATAVSREYNSWGETFGRTKIADSQARLECDGCRVPGSARFAARVAARLLGPVSGQAPRREHDLWHGRHRDGGLLGVLHAGARRSWHISGGFEQGHGRSNCASLFGIAKIPSDNHIRDMLDPASPMLLRPVFAETVDQLQRIDGGLEVFHRLDRRVLIALDGTEYHCSRKIHCQHCLTRVRAGWDGIYHAMLAATLVAPGHEKVIPLEPEFISRRTRGEAGWRTWRQAWLPPTASATPQAISATICSLASRSVRRYGRRRAFHLRLQAIVASADPDYHRYRRNVVELPPAAGDRSMRRSTS